jgi:hypothetical protein
MSLCNKSPCHVLNHRTLNWQSENIQESERFDVLGGKRRPFPMQFQLVVFYSQSIRSNMGRSNVGAPLQRDTPNCVRGRDKIKAPGCM